MKSTKLDKMGSSKYSGKIGIKKSSKIHDNRFIEKGSEAMNSTQINNRNNSGSYNFSKNDTESSKSDCQSICSQIHHERIVKAIQILKKQEECHNGTTSKLFDESKTVSLMISLEKIPTSPLIKPLRIKVPYSIYDENPEICVITKSPQKKYKEAFQKQKVPYVQKVIDVQKLKKKFSTFKSLRELYYAFDFFVCDKSLNNKMQDCLGKFFIKKRKLPVPVKMDIENLNHVISYALHSTQLFISTGPSIAVKIGRTSMMPDRLAENSKSVIRFIEDFFQTNPIWRNKIQSINIQATSTTSLPLYINPEIKLEMEKRLKGNITDISDEKIPNGEFHKNKSAIEKRNQIATDKKKKKTVRL